MNARFIVLVMDRTRHYLETNLGTYWKWKLLESLYVALNKSGVVECTLWELSNANRRTISILFLRQYYISPTVKGACRLIYSELPKCTTRVMIFKYLFDNIKLIHCSRFRKALLDVGGTQLENTVLTYPKANPY